MVDLYLGYDVGPQADIWMLGCNAYFLAFLKHPFQDEGKLAIVSANYS
jgi:cyclin G-associated kinase